MSSEGFVGISAGEEELDGLVGGGTCVEDVVVNSVTDCEGVEE